MLLRLKELRASSNLASEETGRYFVSFVQLFLSLFRYHLLLLSRLVKFLPVKLVVGVFDVLEKLGILDRLFFIVDVFPWIANTRIAERYELVINLHLFSHLISALRFVLD